MIRHGAASSFVLEPLPGEAPLWRHWGLRLPDGATPPAPLRDARPLPSFSPDFDHPLTLFPTFGIGWFGPVALRAHRDGRDFAHAFDDCAIDGDTVTLTDRVAAIRVVITLNLDPVTDVLTVVTTLHNDGATPLSVDHLASAVLPLPADAAHVVHYHGRHNHEFVEAIDALGMGGWQRVNRRGLTSHDAVPGAVVIGADGGAAFGAQIAWSGNHVQTIDRLDDGRYVWMLGAWLAPGELTLAPGASWTAPAVLAIASAAGRNGVAQGFHAAIRTRSDWAGGTIPPRKVHLNTWEGRYFDHRPADLMALADAAAALGVERFVLDDGWFGQRDDDRSSLGDWTVDARKYPDGLRPLVDRVIAHGMDFGLWVEPEMVNPDSRLYRLHPDWALAIAGRRTITARNQLVLDLSRGDVRDYLFDAIAALLGELPIAYLKWDHNRDLTTAAGADGRAAYVAQVEGAYALIDRLRAAYPAVEIEACAGGGGRIDAGIAARTHRFWTSDNLDPVSRLAIQRGYLQFMPPERMGAHVGASPAHATGRQSALDFRAAVALPGHFGVELDPTTLAPDDAARLATWIARYKDWRGELHHGGVWLGDGTDGLAWQAHGTPRAALLFVFRRDPTCVRHQPPLPLPFVDPGTRYRVTRLDRAEAAMAIDGAWLRLTGLPVATLRAEACAIYRLAG